MARFAYSRWDGTQVGFDFGADDVFSEINDELLTHGDLNQALQRLLQRGFTDRNGERVQGMREILERLRQRRQEMLDQHDIGGAYEEIAERLRQITETERQAIDAFEQAAKESGDQRRQEIARDSAAERRMAMDLLPPDLAGQVRELQNHEWTSPEAEQRFSELMDELRSQMLQSQFNQMSEAMANVSPEQLQRTKDMFNALNQMLEAREAGRETEGDFARFMDEFGDFFPNQPESLEELLQQMAQQMAAMQQMLNSMSPEQRAQLQALSESLLEDMDLRWQVDRLGANLRGAFPQMGWDRSMDFGGQDPLGMVQASELANQLGQMDQLESLLTNAGSPGALADVDLSEVAEMLGKDASRSLEQLAKVARDLRAAGLIDQKEGRLELTPRGVRKIGQNALSDLFSKLVKERMGRHSVDAVGIGHERTYETKPYEFGDPFNLAIERTVRNAIGRAGAGTPVSLTPDDFEVERTETLTRTSTVLLVDLSMSMPMRDNFLAAKKTAMALHSLISTQYPRDYLGIVGFGELARELTPEQLPEATWDYTFGTNMHHALSLARRMLSRQGGGTKQVIMITDGEPTAHLLDDGEPFFSYPPSPQTVAVTLAEVKRATKEGVTINTFMLDATSYLREFIERLTEMNRGRAFFTSPETLGDYVLVDFLDSKRRQRGAGAGRR